MIRKKVKSLNMPWEQEYGYSQAVKVGDTISLSGQVSHDDQGDLSALQRLQNALSQSYIKLID